MQWYPKVCWIHLFNSCTAYTFSSKTFMEQAFTEPSPFFPFVDSKEANPTNFISISSLFCPLSLPQLSDVLCSLFFLLLISSFFQWRRGRRCGSMSSWGPGPPSVRRMRAASSPISLPRPGPFWEPGFFFWMWTQTAYAPSVGTRCGCEPFGILLQ